MSLEEYAFVLLARCNNLMERENSDNMQHAANVSALSFETHRSFGMEVPRDWNHRA